MKTSTRRANAAVTRPHWAIRALREILTQQAIGAKTIARIGAAVRLADSQVMVHLGVERALGQRLLQCVEQAIAAKGVFGLAACKQLVKDSVRDRGGFASGPANPP